jgi:hypothetical protein
LECLLALEFHKSPLIAIDQSKYSRTQEVSGWLLEDSMVRKLALAIVLTTVAGIASATVSSPGVTCTKHWLFGLFPYDVCTAAPPKTVAAPEIDAASAVAGLTLMIGGLAVLRGRRSKITVAKA